LVLQGERRELQVLRIIISDQDPLHWTPRAFS
jgi:hypothetical protein